MFITHFVSPNPTERFNSTIIPTKMLSRHTHTWKIFKNDCCGDYRKYKYEFKNYPSRRNRRRNH